MIIYNHRENNRFYKGEDFYDGDFEALIEIPLEKGEFAKAFLVGEGFVIKEEDYFQTKAVLKVSY